MPTIVSLNVALPREVGADEAPDPQGHAWRTGFFKQPVGGAVMLRAINLDGDGQGDRKNHGGPDKAVLCDAAGHYSAWRSELDAPDLPYGAFGENFSIDGLDEAAVCIGDVFAVGGALVQVSQPRQPCWKISARWQRPDLLPRVQASGRTGWYLRVLQEGLVECGQTLTLRERPHPAWSVGRATSVMNHQADREGARGLLACPPLAEVWRSALQSRLDRTPAARRADAG
jgi:MOSC domain-containing protein YiiM